MHELEEKIYVKFVTENLQIGRTERKYFAEVTAENFEKLENSGKTCKIFENVKKLLQL